MTDPTRDLAFLLTNFKHQTPGVAHAIGVSADGLLVASSSGLPRDRADQLAAVASGLSSLLRSAANLLEAGRVISNLTELDGGFLFSMAVSTGASLFVLAARNADIGTVAHEMTELINRVGTALTPTVRENYFAPMPVGGGA
jgi:predicted regulator of Ras-like GTPase activity (Roadblock/LC7/MglB family)